MKLSIKSAAAGVTTLALAGTMVIAGGGVANAATPPYDPAANGATQGTLSLYNAAGQQIVSGSLNTPPAYVRANTDTGRPGDTLATIFAATPVEGANALTWPNDQISTSQAYPTSSPSVPANMQGGTLALGSGIFSWLNPATSGSYAEAFPNTNSTASWQNLYQLRILTSGPGQAPNASRFASTSIQIDTTAGTWTQVYPTVAATPTTTVLTANPPSPSDSGTPITLSATISPAAAAGSVEFFDGATSLGSSSVSGGVATQNVSSLSVGSHSLNAVFTPSAGPGGTVGYAGSNGTLTYQSNQGPAANTTTALSVNPTAGPAYANVALHADVTRTSNGNVLGAGSGTVKFFDGATQISSVAMTASGADLSYNNFASGAHSLTAQFVPSNAQNFSGSTSPAISANYDQPACQSCVDPQTVQVEVPAGTLSISTPYTPSNPFSLGTMVLDSNGIAFSASKPFPKPGDQPLTITDTRAGDLPWTAQVTSTDFTSSTDVIAATGLSYTNVVPSYIVGNALQAPDVATSNVPSVAAGPHTFASAANGSGTVYIDGQLNLTAPSSADAGLYTATVTFTIA